MIFLALRYLIARRRQTILTLLGIFFGAAAYVSISGFFLGFREYLIDQLVNNSAHVHVQAREEFLDEHSLDASFYGKPVHHVFWSTPPSGRKDSAMVENPQSWYRRLAADPRVAAYSPQLSANVIFSKGRATASAALVGTDPVQQVRITTIGDYVIAGSWSDLAAGGNRIAIGEELRKKLGVIVSQNILIASAKSPPTPFKVVAVFKTGNVQADTRAYGAITDAQRLNRTPNQVNEIAVRLHDHTQAAALATTWSALSPEKVESWDQQNVSLFSVFALQDAIRFLSIGAIMIVAGFGIYNVLNMTVVQKRRDIAILRSMGYSSNDVVWLFFSQGLILGLSGVALGLGFGYLLGLYLQTVPFGATPLGRGAGHLLISFSPAIYLQAALLAMMATLLASVLPARAAGKLAPIEIIRAGTE